LTAKDCISKAQCIDYQLESKHFFVRQSSMLDEISEKMQNGFPVHFFAKHLSKLNPDTLICEHSLNRSEAFEFATHKHLM
jgi:hypothetical protein